MAQTFLLFTTLTSRFELRAAVNAPRSDLCHDLSRLLSFLKIAVKVLSALGFSVQNFPMFGEQATVLSEMLPQDKLSTVLTKVVVPSLFDSFELLGASFRTWYNTLSPLPFPPFEPDLDRANAALLAIQEARSKNLSQFGLDSATVFSSDSSLRLPDRLPQPKRPPDRLPQPKRKNSESASSSSLHDGSGSSLVSRTPKEVAPSAKEPKTSAAGQRLPHFSDCDVNGVETSVSRWGSDYVDVTALLIAFKAQHPKLPASQLQDFKILPVLLTSRHGDDFFRQYAPRDASDATMHALRSWYDIDKWQEFSVDAPSDFR